MLTWTVFVSIDSSKGLSNSAHQVSKPRRISVLWVRNNAHHSLSRSIIVASLCDSWRNYAAEVYVPVVAKVYCPKHIKIPWSIQAHSIVDHSNHWNSILSHQGVNLQSVIMLVQSLLFAAGVSAHAVMQTPDPRRVCQTIYRIYM